MDRTSFSEEFPKCEIIFKNFLENPNCTHGPTVLFSRNGKRFFACSAFRSRKLCPFYLEENEYLRKSGFPQQFEEVKSEASPEDNKGQAQYFFSDSTLKFILSTLKNLKISNILCIGTPSIHQEFQGKSYLLDIDESFDSKIENFSLYNMCNHHFFGKKTNYFRFLEECKSLTIICDPAFGARLELLFNTFSLIDSERKSFGHKKPTKVFLIHPYFSEGKILKLDNTVKMSDYRIEYDSHKKFKNGEKSPIRFFTNLDLSKIKLPGDNYKYCDGCQKYVFNISQHCDVCQSCDSRDGRKYKHCFECNKCFKETWSHCMKCKSCHLSGQCTKVNKRKHI